MVSSKASKLVGVSIRRGFHWIAQSRKARRKPASTKQIVRRPQLPFQKRHFCANRMAVAVPLERRWRSRTKPDFAHRIAPRSGLSLLEFISSSVL